MGSTALPRAKHSGEVRAHLSACLVLKSALSSRTSCRAEEHWRQFQVRKIVFIPEHIQTQSNDLSCKGKYTDGDAGTELEHMYNRCSFLAQQDL